MVNLLNEETGTGEIPDPSSLFDAPDLSKFIKLPQTATAKEYEQRVKALMKAGAIGALNAQNLPDAATLLTHGPGFAAAAGQLAEADARAKGVIDMLTTPASPWGMFLVTAIPMFAQLARNHEGQLRQVPANLQNRKERKAQKMAEREAQPKVTVHLPFGKSVKIGVKAKFPVGRIFGMFRGQTKDPRQIAFEVFSNPAVVRELQKQGVVFQQTGNGNG